MGRTDATIGVIGATTRFDLIKDFFLDFNRDPHKNQTLVEHYVKNLHDIEISILSLAVEQLRTQERMPKWTEIRDAALKEMQGIYSDVEVVDCEDCDRDGLIRSVFKNGREIYKLEQGDKDGLYSEVIIGKCHCLNGQKYASYKEATTPNWIKSYAETRKIPLLLATSEIAISLNKKAREQE